jgi:hypothetical protein
VRAFTANDGVAYIAELERAQLERRKPEFDLSVFRSDVAQRVHDFPSAVRAALQAQEILRGIEFETVLLLGIKEAWNELNERQDREIKACVRLAVETRNARFDATTSVERETDPTRANIERAIQALDLLPGKMDRAVALAGNLALLAKGPQRGNKESHRKIDTPSRFLAGNDATVRKQLTELARRSRNHAERQERGGSAKRADEQLTKRILGLSTDTRNALEAALTGKHFPINLAALAPVRKDDGTPVPAAWLEHSPFPDELRQIAELAEAALRRTPVGRRTGRPPNHHAMTVARILVRAYPELTGRPPTFSHGTSKNEDPVHGAFYQFGRKVFRIIVGKHHNALSYLSRAAYELRGTGRKK